MTIDELSAMPEPELSDWINDPANSDSIRSILTTNIEMVVEDLSRTELRELLTDAMLYGVINHHTGAKGPLSEMSEAQIRAELRHVLDYWRG